MNSKKSILTFLTLTLLVFVTGIVTAAPMGTAFTYQGRLASGGQPANGIYDSRFGIYDSAEGGGQIGTTLTNSAVAVTNGLFTVLLDFGNGVFTGDARWLEIGVRTNGGGVYTTLSPRQPLTPSPYALFAPTAGTASTANTATTATTASNVVAGSVNNAALASGAVTSDKITDGTIVDADVSSSGISGDKIIGGDLQAARLKVGSAHTLSGTGTTIAGGYTNTASSDFATVGGGQHNTASGWDTTVAGGEANTASSTYGTVGGGVGNIASGDDATIAGGAENTASGPNAFVGGGHYNNASGDGATVGGGYLNTAAGANSFAAGHWATALHDGAFVWADNADAYFSSTASNQFIVRAAGGVGIGTNNPQSALHVAGIVTAAAFAGSGTNLTGVAPASGSTAYVAKSGDTMTGALNLPPNGLAAGSSQLVLSGGNVGIGTTDPATKLEVQGGPIKAAGGLIIETRTSDPPSPATGQIWLRTDL